MIPTTVTRTPIHGFSTTTSPTDMVMIVGTTDPITAPKKKFLKFALTVPAIYPRTS